MAAVDEAQGSTDEKETSEELRVENSEGKIVKLEDLKVSELKNELEKRNLDKNGLKSVLVERLKTAMLEKGENPEELDPSSTFTCSNLSEKDDATRTSEANEVIGSTDEEKQEVALQLSLDEEEAQLNEENLIESTKQSDESSKIDEAVVTSTCEKPSGNELTSSVKTEKNEPAQAEVEVHAVDSAAISPKVSKVAMKTEKLKPAQLLAKSVWISGLPNDTRPADLKNLFSNQGKVLSVKILKSAKQTPGKCFGLVTMATGKDATKAIQNLHKTELKGHIISVEKKQKEVNSLIKKEETNAVTSTDNSKKVTMNKSVPSPKKLIKSPKKTTPDKKIEKSDEGKEKKASVEVSVKKSEKTKMPEKIKETKEKDSKDIEKKSEKRISSRPYNHRYEESFRDQDPRAFMRRQFSNRIGSTFRPRSSYFLQKMREERFQRERQRERREAERRRIDELTRHRYIERKQREEAYRLEREKERLRIEREFLEREKAEIIKLEREKHRLERERLERERDELRRQAELRSAKRPFSYIDREPKPMWIDRKKPASRYEVHLRPEAPSSSHFEFVPRERSSSFSRDRSSFGREYDRHTERFNSQKHAEVVSRGFVDRDTRREITIRREERKVFARSDYRDRDSRRSISTREPERNSSRREIASNDWKQERRVHERVSSSSGQRRLNYY